MKYVILFSTKTNTCFFGFEPKLLFLYVLSIFIFKNSGAQFNKINSIECSAQDISHAVIDEKLNFIKTDKIFCFRSSERSGLLEIKLHYGSLGARKEG